MDEISSTEEQLELWRLICDNVWDVFDQQATPTPIQTPAVKQQVTKKVSTQPVKQSFQNTIKQLPIAPAPMKTFVKPEAKPSKTNPKIHKQANVASIAKQARSTLANNQIIKPTTPLTPKKPTIDMSNIAKDKYKNTLSKIFKANNEIDPQKVTLK